ncbi:NnrU family protein [Novosphingobium sp.]|uniref:NnrU family protein n=1 Tax=Novosphingobium sp. TaxID=1874826 RepID=UPI003D0E8773
MPIELIILLAATVVFVGGHFALSHPLRRAAIAVFGEQGFRIAYSVIAAASLAIGATAFRYAPRDPVLWLPGVGPQVAYDVLTGLALVLLAGSVSGNPALLAPVSAGQTNRSGGRERQLGHLPKGVFEITRHPMNFAFALWSLAEFLLAPNARDLVFFGGLAVLAIYGSRAQDRKLTALIGAPWVTWMERTPFWPDLRRIAAPGGLWLLALLVWLGLTWFHTYALHAPVGVWLADSMLNG